MGIPWLSLCSLVLLTTGQCTTHGYIDKTESHFRYWQYISLNGTSPLLFQNVRDVMKDGTLEKTQINRGTHAESRDEIVSSRWLSLSPPLELTSETVENSKCREDSEKFVRHLKRMDVWALKMHDSSGKVPSGLLNGNINQFGDFDQCLDVDEPQVNIKGKYCLVYFQIHNRESQVESSQLSKAFDLLHSHFFFRSKLTDPGHRVPRFSTLNWGFCIPHTCAHSDLQSHLEGIVNRYTNGTGFDVEIKVESEMCQQRKPFKVSASFLTVSCFFGFVIFVTALATLLDVFRTTKEKSNGLDSFLRCFSLKRNVRTLVNVSRSEDDVQSVHGVRMLNALMLVLCHKSMALFFIPYSNRTSMVEKLSQPWSIIARIASLYTDSFIMLSGLLTSYSFLRTLNRTGKLDLRSEYLNRLIRIVPPLAAIILLCTFILPEMGSGPQWNLTVSHHADKCKRNWWRNLLFVHNYFGFENMCLTHTHHMGIDSQLFFLSPLLVYVLFKWPVYGTSLLVGMAATSTMARYSATVEKNLSFFIYPGISVSRMFDTANYSYIIPFHRLTSYVIGIFFGFLLRQYGKSCRVKSSYLRIGWTVTLTFLSYVLVKAYDMNRPEYVYDSMDAGVYAALAPIAWCLLVGWIIFVSHMGCGGTLGKLTSSKYYLIWTRLSYSVYLTQFPIFFFNVGLQKHPQQYSIFLLVNVLEYLSILLASVMLTLLFDLPFVNLKKLLIQR
ncbi:hypothetical protein RUM44_006787 [Polyplax serrata]|uniref:Nose resistant-to-fluoxetine protein N-terminal domain-containing protein n=1 Tax=Polyplax serrata TaxID=468196 RepID=A0ABR1AJ19_POLSC